VRFVSPASTRIDVLGAFNGAPATVDLIVRYARESQRDPAVRLFAETLVQNIASKDYLSEALAAYFGALKYTRYANDPRSVELVRKPSWVVREIAAGRKPSLDCDDLVAFLGGLLLSLGREVRIVTVAFHNMFHNGQRQFSHVYLQVREPRTHLWITLDPVAAEDVGKMLSRVRAIKIWPVA
jgi:hypothetical protein